MFFEALNSWIQKSEDMTQSILAHAGLGLNTPVKGDGDESHRQDPCQAPETWTAAGGTSHEWRIVVNTVIADDNSFLITPSRLLADTNVVKSLKAAFDREIPQPFTRLDDIRPRLEGLSTLPGIHEVHYRTVPKYVSDEHFWISAVWRLDVLAACGPVAAPAVLRILNTEPSPLPDGVPRQKNVGVVVNDALLSKMEEQLAATRRMVLSAQQKRDTISGDISSCRSNAQLLQNILRSSDPADKKVSIDLSESVAESCVYYKTKMAAHLAALQHGEADEEIFIASPDLEPPEGSLYRELIAANEELHDALSAFSAWRVKQQQLLNHGGHHSPTHSAPSQAVPDETAFNATLPWDDDE